MELIKIQTNENGEQLISGRELHQFLEVATPYKKWFDRMCEYGFIENKDFLTVDKNVHGQNGQLMPQKEVNHLMKISMAKELSMIQRNEKGKQAREYFIKCEEAWNSDEMIMARALQIQNRKLLNYKEKIETLESANASLKKDKEELKADNEILALENQIQQQKILELEPIKEYYDIILSSPHAMTISQIAADYGMTGAELNQMLNKEGVIKKIGGQWLLCKAYLGKGYTQSKTYSYKTVFGLDMTKVSTHWTQKGRLKIHEILTKKGIKANYDKTLENGLSSL